MTTSATTPFTDDEIESARKLFDLDLQLQLPTPARRRALLAGAAVRRAVVIAPRLAHALVARPV